MGTAKKLLRSVIESLELCGLCKDKLLEDDESDTSTRSTKQFDIEYDESSVSTKVRFANSTLQNVTVYGCIWENVTFTNCELSNVYFKNVNFKNLHFNGIDFHNVTIQDAELESVQWDHQWIKHAFLTGKSFEASSLVPDLRLSLPKATPLSRTKAAFIGSDEVGISEKGDSAKPSELRRIVLNTVPPKGLLSLPDSILSKIAACLLPGTWVKIVNWSEKSGHRPTGQTTYWSEECDEPTTYTTPKLGLDVSLLRVNRRLYKVAIPLLYEKDLCFSGGYASHW